MQPDNLLDIFKALANANRQEILFKVFSDKQPHSVTEVADRIGLATSTTSEHLSALKRAGLLRSEKIDKQVLYTVNKATVERVLVVLQNWLTCC